MIVSKFDSIYFKLYVRTVYTLFDREHVQIYRCKVWPWNKIKGQWVQATQFSLFDY